MKDTLKFLLLGARSMWCYKRLSAAFLAASIGQSIATAVTLWVIKHFLDLVARSGGEKSHSLLIAAALIFTMWMARAATSGISKVAEGRLLKAVSLEWMMKLSTHLLRQSVAFFDGASRGDLVLAVRSDVQTMYQSVHCLCVAISSMATFLTLAVTAYLISPLLCMTALVVVPILTLPVGLYGGRLLENARSGRKTGCKLVDRLLDLCAGLRLIKIYKSEKYELNEYRKIADQHYELQVRATVMQATAGVLLEAVAGCGLVLVIVMGGYEVVAGRLGWAALLTFMMAMTSLFEPIRTFTHIYASVQGFLPGLERIGALMGRTPDITDRPNAHRLLRPPRRITLERLCFSYDGNEPVLRDINLEINAGEVIGIVGPSGAGKSSLMSLLLRYYDPTGGRICLDGVDLREVTLDSLYDNLAAVLQTPFVFSTTVRENIRYGRMKATDEEVEEAARDANLHDEILALPKGYDTRLGTGGQDLSGGQRQRLNIARALLKNAPVLLLDEATSSLDSVSEVRIQEAIERLMRGRTVIAIAHRLSTLRCADRIVVLRDGSIEAVGRHHDLLRRSATYRKLCEHQFISLEGDPMPVGPVVVELSAVGVGAPLR